MLKRIFFIFVFLNLFNLVFAQIKTPVELVGKNKGKVQVMSLQGEPFVAGRTFGRVLGMQSTWFGASGRLELSSGSNKAELKKNQPFAIVNKQKSRLSQAPVEQGGVLYIPLSFFNKFSSYDTVYEQNKLIVERRYSLSFLKQENKESSTQIVLKAKGELPFRTEKSTKDKVSIFFPGAVVKRDEVLSAKNGYLYRVRITQKAKGVQLFVMLKKNAKYWDFYYNGKDFIFEAASSQIERNVSQTEQEDENVDIKVLRPSVLQNETETETESEEIIELGDDFFTASVTETTPKVSAVTTPSKPLPAPTILPAVTKNKGKLKVLIDPGHGGKDPGATRRGSAKEKELNLKVAKQIYDLLKKEKNVEVKMTRNDDTFISLGERARMSVNYDSDIFVSIHTNAAKRSTASGFEVYFRSDKASDAEAAQTAALENEALQYEGQTSSGLSFADFAIPCYKREYKPKFKTCCPYPLACFKRFCQDRYKSF